MRALYTMVIVLVGGPCLLFGLLGITGRLSDTSERENLYQGVLCFATALCPMAFGIIGLVFEKRLDAARGHGATDD